MAVTVASLQAVLELDNKKFNRSLKASENALKKVEGSLPEIGESADKLGKSFDKMGDEGKKALYDVEAGADNAKGGIGGLFSTMGAAGIATAGLGLVIGAITAIGKATFDMSQEFNSAMRSIEARTGKTGDELEALGDTVLEVYKDNWGENLADVSDAIVTVNQVLGQTDDALKRSAESAIIMRDVFGMDIPESVRAADVAVTSFGVDSQEVFDAMAAVIQRVGDPADDLADTINEYAPIFAQTGFNFEEMMGILEAGLAAGARNFDVVADAVKEFQIRIVDGSETTEEALHNLFEATGQGSQQYDTLIEKLDETSYALEVNQEALEDSEGAYKAQEQVVKGLQGALDTARRELEKLARPNLKGVEEFDDKLFELEQQAKRAQLALLDLEPDTKAYETTSDELDRVNKEIDKLSLRRDLIFDEQFRTLEKAVKDATEETITYEEALNRIGSRVGEIEVLGDALEESKDILWEMGQNAAELEDKNESLISQIEELTGLVENFQTPAREMLMGLASGETTGRDAMSRVIQMLKLVDDQVLQNQIGVALFGTKWEDLGPQIILALDPAEAKLIDFAGTVDEAGNAVSSGLLAQLSAVGREIKTTLIGALDDLGKNKEVQNFVAGLMPVFDVFSDRLNETIIPALESVNELLTAMAALFNSGNKEISLASELLIGLQYYLNKVTENIEAISVVFYTMADAINIVNDLIADAKTSWSGFGDTLSNITDKIPEWLVPGSPTPLELGLRGIGEAVNDLPDIGQTVMTPPAGTSTSMTLNMGGQNFNFAGDDSSEQAIQMVVQILRSELSRA